MAEGHGSPQILIGSRVNSISYDVFAKALATCWIGGNLEGAGTGLVSAVGWLTPTLSRPGRCVQIGAHPPNTPASRTATLVANRAIRRHSVLLRELESGFLNGRRRSVNRKVQGSSPCPGATLVCKVG